MDDLESWIFDEHKVVSYKWLSLVTSIPSNAAKKQLYTFWQKYPERTDPSFFVCGFSDETKEKMVACIVPFGKLEETKRSLGVVMSVHVYSVEPKRPQQEGSDQPPEIARAQLSAKLWEADTEHAREMQKGVQNQATENLRENRTSSVGCGQEVVVAAAKAIAPAPPRAIFKKKEPTAPAKTGNGQKSSNLKRADSKGQKKASDSKSSTKKGGTMKSFFNQKATKPKEQGKQDTGKQPEKQSEQEAVLDWLEEDTAESKETKCRGDPSDANKDKDLEAEVKESPQLLRVKRGQKALQQLATTEACEDQGSSEQSSDEEMEWNEGGSSLPTKSHSQKQPKEVQSERSKRQEHRLKASDNRGEVKPHSTQEIEGKAEVICLANQSSDDDSNKRKVPDKDAEIVTVDTQSSEDSSQNTVQSQPEKVETSPSQLGEGEGLQTSVDGSLAQRETTSKSSTKRPVFASTSATATQKRKMRKKVQKTKMDDKGYMVVYDEWIEVSADEDESELPAKKTKLESKTKPATKKTTEKKKPTKKNAGAKQSSMLSFFSKK